MHTSTSFIAACDTAVTPGAILGMVWKVHGHYVMGCYVNVHQTEQGTEQAHVGLVRLRAGLGVEGQSDVLRPPAAFAAPLHSPLCGAMMD
jgi:hypothetical protein